jgi:catechol 2,3-dioxygenase-like lactoylglutathione lyase family enzyme
MTDLTGALLPSLDWGEVFHVGIRVADLAAAQQEFTESLGLSWTVPATMPMKTWAPDEGYRRDQLTISFSTAGPVHVELMVGSAGSYWDAALHGTGLHHIGVWVEDVTKVNTDLVGKGWTVELAGRSPEEGYGGFTYVRSPAGVLVEPETFLGGARERFDKWYAGGSLF